MFLVKKYVPQLDPANRLKGKSLIYIYTIYVSWKLGLGGERYSEKATEVDLLEIQNLK